MSHRGGRKKGPKKDHQTQIISSIIAVLAIGALILFYFALRTHG